MLVKEDPGDKVFRDGLFLPVFYKNIYMKLNAKKM